MGRIAQAVSKSISFGRDPSAYTVAFAMIGDKKCGYDEYRIADRADAAERNDQGRARVVGMALVIRTLPSATADSRALCEKMIAYDDWQER